MLRDDLKFVDFLITLCTHKEQVGNYTSAVFLHDTLQVAQSTANTIALHLSKLLYYKSVSNSHHDVHVGVKSFA